MTNRRQEGETRRYRSPLRQEQAEETRRRIVAAAAELFVGEGYAGTTMRAVATAAGVAERTVYIAFPHKAALLAATIEAAVRAEDGTGIPLREQGSWRAITVAPPGELAPRLAAATTALWQRTARLIAVAEAAAASDPELAELRARGHDATRADLRYVAEAMHRQRLLRDDLDVDRAADVLFALLGSEDVYLRLVNECGWEPSAYTALVERLVVDGLLEPPPRHSLDGGADADR